MLLKDDGNGVTAESLDFWRANKDKIGPVSFVEVHDDLHVEQSPEGYPLEYPCAIYGADGVIYLSGCTCGYGGEGPNGTAKILADVGLPLEEARKLVLCNVVSYYAFDRRIA